MEAAVAKVFELSKLENFNEELLPCFEVLFKLPDEKRQEVIKEFVKEGGLKEILKRPEEEILTLDDKLYEALEFYQESLKKMTN